MKATNTKFIGRRSDGKRIVQVLLVSNNTPDPLPTTGESIDGMNADDVFAPFSVLYITANDAANKVYLANEDGIFVAQ